MLIFSPLLYLYEHQNPGLLIKVKCFLCSWTLILVKALMLHQTLSAATERPKTAHDVD